jgi:hypothetical protein
MNEMSRRELEAAFQQITNTIYSQKNSQDNVSIMLQALVPKICSKQELRTILDESREKYQEKITSLIRSQQNVLQQLNQQTENISHHIAQLETRVDAALSAVQTVQNETETLMGVNHLRYPNQVLNNAY